MKRVWQCVRRAICRGTAWVQLTLRLAGAAALGAEGWTTHAASSNPPIPIGAPAAPAPADGAEASLRDIRGPVEVPNLWMWAGIGIGILVLVGIAAWGWSRWRARGGGGAKDVVSAEDRARRRLREALTWLHEPERFVVAVSEAIREFLEVKTGVHAPDRTTEEFLAEIGSRAALEDSQQTLLSGFLTQADLVKFAKEEPARDVLEGWHNSALELVDGCSLVKAAPAGVGGPGVARAASAQTHRGDAMSGKDAAGENSLEKNEEGEDPDWRYQPRAASGAVARRVDREGGAG